MGMINNIGEHILNFNHGKILKQLTERYPGKSIIKIQYIHSTKPLYIYNREEFSDSIKYYKKTVYNITGKKEIAKIQKEFKY